MKEALLLISNKGFGCLGITDESGQLVGIITDGDLRRHLSGDIFKRPVEEVMTPDPKTIGPDALVASALEVLNAAAITALMVVEDKTARSASSTCTICSEPASLSRRVRVSRTATVLGGGTPPLQRHPVVTNPLTPSISARCGGSPVRSICLASQPVWTIRISTGRAGRLSACAIAVRCLPPRWRMSSPVSVIATPMSRSVESCSGERAFPCLMRRPWKGPDSRCRTTPRLRMLLISPRQYFEVGFHGLDGGEADIVAPAWPAELDRLA